MNRGRTVLVTLVLLGLIQPASSFAFFGLFDSKDKIKYDKANVGWKNDSIYWLWVEAEADENAEGESAKKDSCRNQARKNGTRSFAAAIFTRHLKITGKDKQQADGKDKDNWRKYSDGLIGKINKRLGKPQLLKVEYDKDFNCDALLEWKIENMRKLIRKGEFISKD